jgi:hypothetical protein
MRVVTLDGPGKIELDERRLASTIRESFVSAGKKDFAAFLL